MKRELAKLVKLFQDRLYLPDATPHGLAVIPLGQDGGKIPLVSFGKWLVPPGHDFIDQLVTKYGNANVGIVCHLSSEKVFGLLGFRRLPTARITGGVHELI